MYLKTYKEMVAWVEANIPKEKLDGDTAENAILEYYAVREALTVLEKTKSELADDILHGLELGPVDEKFVNADLHTYWNIDFYMGSIDDPIETEDERKHMMGDLQAELVHSLYHYFGVEDPNKD